VERGINHVISLVDQPLPQWLRTRYQTLQIRNTEFLIQDDELEDILEILGQVSDLIGKDLDEGKNGILVHCGLGVSRSGSAVVAYCRFCSVGIIYSRLLKTYKVMRSRKLDRDEALRFVKMKRPRVQPNSGFWRQLEIWGNSAYEVWEEVDGIRQEKEEYREWKSDAAKKMEARVQDFGSNRQSSHLAAHLRGFQLKPTDQWT
jgi:hypothetical protein